MKKKILVAEDDSNIRSGLLDALEADGHEAEDFPMERFRHRRLSAGQMGSSSARYHDAREERVRGGPGVRATGSEVPILMLTAKSEEIDKVLGFEMGTDDS